MLAMLFVYPLGIKRGLYKRKNFFLLLSVLLLFFASCGTNKSVKKYKIGLSQCTTGDVWRQYMQKEIERELTFHPEIELIIKNANLNSDKQIEQINELVKEEIDLLIVTPNEAAPLTPIVDKLYKNGLPVIVVDRSTLSKNFTAFIGANNYKVGINAGAYTTALLKGKGIVLEINGSPFGSSADIGRHDGFVDYIKKFPEIIYKFRFVVDNRTQAWESSFKEYVKANQDINLIYSHDDRMALVVYKIIKSIGLEQKIKVIGVDGLPGENGGIDLVEKGVLKATILYPTGGKEAILTAIDILEKKPYSRENELASTVIDSTNVRIMKMQNEKLFDQQADIDKQQKKLKNKLP